VQELEQLLRQRFWDPQMARLDAFFSVGNLEKCFLPPVRRLVALIPSVSLPVLDHGNGDAIDMDALAAEMPPEDDQPQRKGKKRRRVDAEERVKRSPQQIKGALVDKSVAAFTSVWSEARSAVSNCPDEVLLLSIVTECLQQMHDPYLQPLSLMALHLICGAASCNLAVRVVSSIFHALLSPSPSQPPREQLQGSTEVRYQSVRGQPYRWKLARGGSGLADRQVGDRGDDVRKGWMAALGVAQEGIDGDTADSSPEAPERTHLRWLRAVLSLPPSPTQPATHAAPSPALSSFHSLALAAPLAQLSNTEGGSVYHRGIRRLHEAVRCVAPHAIGTAVGHIARHGANDRAAAGLLGALGEAGILTSTIATLLQWMGERGITDIISTPPQDTRHAAEKGATADARQNGGDDLQDCVADGLVPPSVSASGVASEVLPLTVEGTWWDPQTWTIHDSLPVEGFFRPVCPVASTAQPATPPRRTAAPRAPRPSDTDEVLPVDGLAVPQMLCAPFALVPEGQNGAAAAVNGVVSEGHSDGVDGRRLQIDWSKVVPLL